MPENITNCIRQIHQLRKELKHKEIDGFEFYFEKENLLQELSYTKDKKELFYDLFINDNTKELSDDDKIVALTGITRYDIEKFSNQMFRNQNLLMKIEKEEDKEDEKNKKNKFLETIKKYGNEIFEKLKNEILSLITIIKDLIVQEVKDFLNTYSPKFKELALKLGEEFIRFIIRSINGGETMKTILITIPKGLSLLEIENNESENEEEEEKEVLLSSIITKSEFKKLKEFSKKIKQLYESKYSEIESKINNIITNINEVKDNYTCGCF